MPLLFCTDRVEDKKTLPACYTPKAGHRWCNFLSCNLWLQERKLLNSPISTVSDDGGISPVEPLCSVLPGGGVQGAVIITSGFGHWPLSHAENMSCWLFPSRLMDRLGYIQHAHGWFGSQLVPAEPTEIQNIFGWLKVPFLSVC